MLKFFFLCAYLITLLSFENSICECLLKRKNSEQKHFSRNSDKSLNYQSEREKKKLDNVANHAI